MPSDYPRNVRLMRKRLGLTLAETARGAGTTPAQVMKLENGDRRLTLTWIERLATAFACDPLDLIDPRPDIPVVGEFDAGWAVRLRAEPFDKVPRPRTLAGEDHVALLGMNDGGAFEGWVALVAKAGIPADSGDWCYLEPGEDRPHFARIGAPVRGAFPCVAMMPLSALTGIETHKETYTDAFENARRSA